MNRVYQLTLIGSVVGLSWLGMMIVHEVGHVVVAWICGETVSQVVLHPLAISRTDVTHVRHPILVGLGGPLLGSLIPVFAWVAVRLARLRVDYLVRFFAGFCLISNGLYLGVGSFSAVGDAGDHLRYGGSRWLLILFGVIATPAGFFLWNGLGLHFGLGPNGREAGRTVALGSFGLLLALILVEVVVDGW